MGNLCLYLVLQKRFLKAYFMGLIQFYIQLRKRIALMLQEGVLVLKFQAVFFAQYVKDDAQLEQLSLINQIPYGV
jgi:hypothetical protein